MLRVRITHTAADNTIARIIHLVEEAQGSKAPTARFIDRFSAYYTPAAMAGGRPDHRVPPLLFGADWYTWIYRGLATLLIACPCALVISTPAAIASALAAGARRGLLIKGGAALETIGKVRTVAFDKTGTLTVGRPRVTDVAAIEGSDDDVLAKAAAVERGSSHPLGLAIIAAAEARNLTDSASLRGERGARQGGDGAAAGGLRVGRLAAPCGRGRPHCRTTRPPKSKPWRPRARRSSSFSSASAPSASSRCATSRGRMRRRASRASRQLGIRTVMLTGDNRRTGNAIGGALGLDVRSELLPDAKLAAIGELKKAGPVAMVGDGINDAPALAAASVGVAMGGGTDVALETAEAALLKNRVIGVAEMVALSRATLSNIWQNITIALGLKAVFLVTTLFGVTSLWMAILADTGATVLVTANALRLLRFRGS